jgi:hypothetical protein
VDRIVAFPTAKIQLFFETAIHSVFFP